MIANATDADRNEADEVDTRTRASTNTPSPFLKDTIRSRTRIPFTRNRERDGINDSRFPGPAVGMDGLRLIRSGGEFERSKSGRGNTKERMGNNKKYEVGQVPCFVPV
jgi:hypothetical protein